MAASVIHFNDRGLEAARMLVKQSGLNWTGMTSEESQFAIDIASKAVRAVDSALGTSAA